MLLKQVWVTVLPADWSAGDDQRTGFRLSLFPHPLLISPQWLFINQLGGFPLTLPNMLSLPASCPRYMYNCCEDKLSKAPSSFSLSLSTSVLLWFHKTVKPVSVEPLIMQDIPLPSRGLLLPSLHPLNLHAVTWKAFNSAAFKNKFDNSRGHNQSL